MDMTEFDLDFLTHKLEDNPRSPLFARLADIYFSQNQIDEAMQICEMGIQNYPSYMAGHVVLGKCYMELKRFENASVEFRAALTICPFAETPRIFLAESLEAMRAEQMTPSSAAAEEPEIVEQENEQENSSSEPEMLIDESAEQETPAMRQTFDQPVSEERAPAYSYNSPVQEERPYALPETIPPAGEASMFPPLEEYIQERLAMAPQAGTVSLNSYLRSGGFEEPVWAQPAAAKEETNSIDLIAEQLKNAERIVPKITKEPPPPAPAPVIEDTLDFDSNIVTPTLAEIYIAQGEYRAAIQAYELLMITKPEDQRKYKKRIEDVQLLINELEGKG